MGSKYHIDGLTLREYCLREGLNYKTQSNRVSEYAKKHPDLSPDEVVKLAFSNYNKISYQGMSLANYCKLIGVDYDTVLALVKELKEEMPGIREADLCKMAIDEVLESYQIYFYEGMPLIDYCKSRPDLKYCEIFMYLRRELLKGTDKSIEDIITEYLENKYHRTYHFVEGMPLKEYCEKNDIGYRSVLSRLSNLRRDERFKGLAEHELLDVVLSGSLNDYFGCYLEYDDQSLYAYCKAHDISYTSAYNLIKRTTCRDLSLNLSIVIDMAVTALIEWRKIHPTCETKLSMEAGASAGRH